MRSSKSQHPNARETSGAKTQMLGRILLSGILPALLCGCGTILNHDHGDRKPYGGVVEDWSVLTGRTSGHGWMPPPCYLVFMLDIPLSLVFDTLTLPCDLYNQHQVKAYQESLRLNPPDPDPLVGWKSKPGVRPKPITEDYQNYIHALPPDQRKALIENDFMVQLFEDSSGAHALQIKILVYRTGWKHVLIYDQSDTRIKVLKYKNSHLVP